MEMPLLTSFNLGKHKLKNRMVMAPMTRSRSFIDNIPHPLASEYYCQRASAGLLITEGVYISPYGIGYLWSPGNYTKDQQKQWKYIVDEVHKNNGVIFQQLWHTGRIAHSSLRPHNELPKAPSAIKPKGRVYTKQGWAEYERPIEMTINDIKEAVQQFKQASYYAKDVGFDGVDIHGAFGYLIDQFICSGTNKRSDMYGGSIDNRLRFVLEIVENILEVWDSQQVGLKISPSSIVNDMSDNNPKETFSALLEKLNIYNLGYVMLMEPQSDISNLPNYPLEVSKYFRPFYNGNLIANANMTKELGNELILSNTAQLVAFGSLFISNPDLPQRFRINAALNVPDRKTYYGGDAHGYTDYPFLQNNN